MPTFKLGELQQSGLEIYVFDPIFDDCPAFDGDYEAFPGTLNGNVLTVEAGREADASYRIVEAANSADDDNDRQLCESLGNLALRIGRRARANP